MAGVETRLDGNPGEAPMVGDHLAMDLLNTEARVNGGAVDYWSSGDDVRRWLARCGVVPPSPGKAVDPAELLAHGTALRRLARALIIQRKQSAIGEISALNRYLHASLSAPHLEHDRDGNLVLARRACGDGADALLGPVAESVAQLLVEGDFGLVKQCEHPDCVLWFYDRTKAHKRRWCSMALCGNRYKAAQFRKRRSGDTS